MKDQARRELAERLRKPLTDILDREEAAAFLGCKHRSSLSNLGALGPAFYDPPQVRYFLYRRDWLEQYAKRAKDTLYGEQPWPPARYTGSHAASEALLDKLTGDDDYVREVMGGGPSAPIVPAKTHP